jgi:hypothetical protein
MKKNLVGFLIVLFLFAATRTHANIAVVNPAPAFYDATESGGDGDTVALNPLLPVYLPVNPLAGSAQTRMVNTLTADFPGWTFIQSALPLNGTLTVDVLEATIFAPHVGGLDIEARYVRAATDPALGRLHFAQLIDTNDPLGGVGNPYIDPRPNDDTAPFYWTFDPVLADEHDVHEMGGANGFGAFDLEFLDEPKRECRDHPDLITWRGDLFLTEMIAYDIQTGTGTVYVYDGIRYGFDFMCVPEPSSVVILVVTIGMFLQRRSAWSP